MDSSYLHAEFHMPTSNGESHGTSVSVVNSLRAGRPGFVSQ
jgi:hypothetical protein